MCIRVENVGQSEGAGPSRSRHAHVLAITPRTMGIRQDMAIIKPDNFVIIRATGSEFSCLTCYESIRVCYFILPWYIKKNIFHLLFITYFLQGLHIFPALASEHFLLSSPHK